MCQQVFHLLMFQTPSFCSFWSFEIEIFAHIRAEGFHTGSKVTIGTILILDTLQTAQALACVEVCQSRLETPDGPDWLSVARGILQVYF